MRKPRLTAKALEGLGRMMAYADASIEDVVGMDQAFYDAEDRRAHEEIESGIRWVRNMIVWQGEKKYAPR